MSARPAADVDALERGVRDANRAVLARAITLVESERLEDQQRARELLDRLAPHAGGSLRVGVTGVPGVGKSTFVDVLGVRLCDAGHRVAVLAVDPSSRVSGGSILGDKTRMVALSRRPEAFIRPSPTSGTLGGVARKTHEAILLCEAAGHDVVLVETVGVGQSETAVSDMVDVFVALLLAGAGDSLQGIKRGLLEVVDVLVLHKADGDRVEAAASAAQQYRMALSILRGAQAPPVLTASARTGEGVDEVWSAVLARRDALGAELEARRGQQRVAWLWRELEGRFRTALRGELRLREARRRVEDDVRAGRRSVASGADELLALFRAPG